MVYRHHRRKVFSSSTQFYAMTHWTTVVFVWLGVHATAFQLYGASDPFYSGSPNQYQAYPQSSQMSPQGEQWSVHRPQTSLANNPNQQQMIQTPTPNYFQNYYQNPMYGSPTSNQFQPTFYSSASPLSSWNSAPASGLSQPPAYSTLSRPYNSNQQPSTFYGRPASQYPQTKQTEQLFVEPEKVPEENTPAAPFTNQKDANLTVPQLIAKYGYPVEIHHVTTDDGYILQLHRIPYGRSCGPAQGKKVIYVQHGLLCDSSSYVLSGPNKSLAYLLADDCYDVWLANARGNTYSRKHVTLDPNVDKEQFWSYSYHEMGIYDLPANFDYILELTGTDGLYYVGHSMGTTMFWICMSERPEYNSKIKLMSALAPIAHTEHMISPIRLIAPFSTQIKWLMKMIGLYEFMPSNIFLKLIGQQACDVNSPIQPICSNLMFVLCGFNPDQLDTSLLPVLLGHLPAGASVRSVIHYAQGVLSGAFRQYDFGSKGNMERYGQPTPPDYDFNKIKAPVAFYWGENDWLGAKPDTLRIAKLLPNIQRMYRIQDDLFNHLDFIVAKRIRELVNDRVLEFLGNF